MGMDGSIAGSRNSPRLDSTKPVWQYLLVQPIPGEFVDEYLQEYLIQINVQKLKSFINILSRMDGPTVDI